MRRILELHDEPIPEWAVRLLSWALAITGLSRGIDYWKATRNTTDSLKIVEAIAPLTTWGAALTLAAAFLVLGLLIRLHELVWLGHLACAGIYIMLTIATAQAIVPTGTGYRGIGPLAIVTLLHVLLALVRGPIPKGTRR